MKNGDDDKNLPSFFSDNEYAKFHDDPLKS